MKLHSVGTMKNPSGSQTILRPGSLKQNASTIENSPLRLERWLDAGRGACVLRQPECRAEIETSLLHDDGKSYELGDFVIMPNHVHALLRPLSTAPASKLLGAAKGASARRINERIGAQGSLWMDESFDHIIRSMDSLKKFQRYIANNPAKAGLPEHEFTYEQRWELK